MTVNVIYRTSATATGGRDGNVASDDGSIDARLVVPKEMGGPGGGGVNPEQLFAAGYAACFLSALKAVSREAGVALPGDPSVTAEVGLGQRSEGGFGITTDLTIRLPGLDPAEARRLVDAAHAICPYSNATRNNVDVGLTIL